MAVCLIALVAVSLMTGHSAKDCSRAVYWEDLPTAEIRGAAPVAAGVAHQGTPAH